MIWLKATLNPGTYYIRIGGTEEHQVQFYAIHSSIPGVTTK